MARLSVSSSVKGNGHATGPPSADTRTVSQPEASADVDYDHFEQVKCEAKALVFPPDPSLSPNGSRSLPLIALQAFLLGFVLAGGILLALLLMW
ncbi:hypothetical protein, partial [Staphylococcus aureus]|uniref:hypothetical protein n=1 Tax=Staphylococcus aureus TaxID=1280 RepID=UPI0019D563DA